MMKKIALIFGLAALLLLCACANTENKPSLNPANPDARVESVALSEEPTIAGHHLERDDSKKSVDHSFLKNAPSEDEIVTLHYTSGDTVIEQVLTEEESATIISLLSARREKKEAPTTAFRDDVCFEVAGYRFSIATDHSGYILNNETGRYVSLNDEKLQLVDEICEKYGAAFPCE